MKFGESVFSMALLVIIVSMYVYAFATGIAITHSDYGDECPICALAKDAAN